VAVTGCGGTVAGSPVPAVVGGEHTAAVNIASLDTGPYPTRARKPLGTAGSSSRGRILEGQRMANDVVMPYEVDPTLRRAIPQSTSTLDSARELPASLGGAAAAHGFLVGFSTGRRSVSPGGEVLINIVLRFPDPGAAVQAAADMAATEGSGQPRTPADVVPIPDHPTAIGFRSGTGTAAGVTSFAPHGSYVFYDYAQSGDGPDSAAALIGKVIALQQPRIDQFSPTDPSKFAEIPIDSTGLLVRTLPLTADSASPDGAVYFPRAALHFQDEPDVAAATFDAAGVQAVAVSRTRIYQAGDAAGAARVADTLAGDARDNGYRPAGAVPGLPSARCFDGSRDPGSSPRRFYCVGVEDRYAYEVFSEHEHDAHQQVAAQYRLLLAH
jgi:hypothetical protein